MSKKEINDQTQSEANDFKNEFATMYSDATMLKLYESEQHLIFAYVKKKAEDLALKNGVIPNGDGEQVVVPAKLKDKDVTNIWKNLTAKDYEKCFPKTITYINDRIFHAYDSRFYVACRDENGSFLPKEYNKGDFNSTFYQYFPDMIQKWFDKNSTKFTLTMNNREGRVYTKGDQKLLNLFSGYKYDKTATRDLERIKKGSAGVNFVWEHCLNTWNSGVEVAYEYDHDWLCKLVAGYKLNTMLYLKGKMGRGKSKLVKFFVNIIGLQVSTIMSNDRAITGQFNGSLMGKSLCYLDEIVHDFHDFKTLYNQLKPYITEEHISYRNLFEKLKMLKNTTSFIMTGNYDMLKLDDPGKGDDRRIKIGDVSDELKSVEYCNTLDDYLDDEDVQYAMFWYCIDNHKPNWNELQELKKLPMSETKKNMVQQSLDSGTLFLKYFVNSKEISTYIKPLTLYNKYKTWMEDTEDKKQCMNKMTFLGKMKDYPDFISFHENMRLDGGNATNYIKIDRDKMIVLFKKKHFWNEYDDIDDDVQGVDPTNYYLRIETENLEMKETIEQLKKQIETMGVVPSNLKRVTYEYDTTDESGDIPALFKCNIFNDNIEKVTVDCKKSKKSKKSKNIVKATKSKVDFPVKIPKKERVSKQMKYKTQKENNDCDDEDIEDIEIVF